MIVTLEEDLFPNQVSSYIISFPLVIVLIECISPFSLQVATA